MSYSLGLASCGRELVAPGPPGGFGVAQHTRQLSRVRRALNHALGGRVGPPNAAVGVDDAPAVGGVLREEGGGDGRFGAHELTVHARARCARTFCDLCMTLRVYASVYSPSKYANSALGACLATMSFSACRASV